MVQKIKFQLADRTGEPLVERIYECEVDVEVMLGHAIPLRPTRGSVIRVTDIVIRPCRICKVPNGMDLLEYVQPEGDGWSDVPFFETIKIVEIIMSMRATIGMTLPNEMIVCVYCYHDGYPEHLGRILAKHYDSEEKIKELMKGGHLTDIETTSELCSYEHKGGAPVADDCRPVTHRNLGDFIQKVRVFGHDYGYVFRDGQWHIYNLNDNNTDVTPI